MIDYLNQLQEGAACSIWALIFILAFGVNLTIIGIMIKLKLNNVEKTIQKNIERSINYLAAQHRWIQDSINPNGNVSKYGE